MTDQVVGDALAPATEDRLREAMAGAYQLDRVIGAGSSAVVFRAFDLKHRRPVAVKVLRPEVAERVGGRRFLQEIEVASRLSHPHVLPLLDSGEASGLVYYVMPLVEGASLRARMRREGPLPLDDAIRISRDVAGALQHAHDRGIVHRDVKPENILLAPDGSASLADFGLARLLQEGQVDRLTGSGLAVGTAWYMSPEQGSADVFDARTDQYALACVLYEMLTGDAPFQGRTVQNILARHRVDPRPHVRHVRESVPVGVDEVMVRAMAIHPADRFPSILDFSRAIEAALTSELLAQGRSSREVSAKRRPPRRTIVAVVVSVVALAITGFFAIKTWVGSADVRQLDERRVAIAPFDVLGVDTIWRFGMVDMLSRNFDGAGSLRSAPPSAVLRAWTGRSDIPSANALAQRTRSGLILFGQLLTSGQGSVVLRATLYDAVARRPVAQDVELRDDLANIPRVADSLTIRLLRELGRTRPISAVPGRSLRSTSLPALKAWLQGEQLLRRNDYVGAGGRYEQAVQMDSTFAMAYHGLRNVRRAIGLEGDSLSRWYGLRAGEHNRGLGPRDSLLVLADSLASALPIGFTFFGLADQAMLRRRTAVLEELVTRYPDDADAWQELGEARLHHGFRVGIAQDSALQAFEQAVAADSGFAPPFFHAVELALTYRAPDSVRALIRRYLHLHPSDGRYRALGLLLSRSNVEQDGGWKLIGAMPHDSALSTAYLLRRWRNSATAAPRLYRDLLSVRGARTGQDTAAARIGLISTLLQRGRMRDVRMLGDRTILDLLTMNAVVLTRYGGADPDSLSALAQVWGHSAQPLQLLSAVQWFGYRRDARALRALSEGINTSLRVTGSPRDSVAVAYVRTALRAYLALAEDDSASARTHFAALPDTLCPWTCWPEVERRVEILLASGRFKDAAQLLDRHPPPTSPAAFIELPWLALRSEAARIIGDPATLERFRHSLHDLMQGADSTVTARLSQRKRAAS